MRFGLLLLRVLVGGIFAAHGYAKLAGGQDKEWSPTVRRYLGPAFVEMAKPGLAGFAGMLGGMNVPLPKQMAAFVAGVEFFGGLAFVAGFFARLAALLLAGDMAVAIAKVHWKNGLFGGSGFEFPLALLAGCLAVLFDGPGRLSLDNLFFGDRQQAALEDLQVAFIEAIRRR